MEEVAAQIEKVEGEIEKVEGQIEAAEQAAERAQDKDALVWLRKKEEQLRKEKEQLRKKEEQLRKEKEQLRKKEEQLREEKLIGLKRSRGEVDDDFPEGEPPSRGFIRRCGVHLETFWQTLHEAKLEQCTVTQQHLGEEDSEQRVTMLKLPGQAVFLGNQKWSSIIIRQSYEDLWNIAEDLMNQRQQTARSGGPKCLLRMVITGTPGAGKSVCGWYFMYKLRKKFGDEIDLVYLSSRAKELSWFARNGRVFGAAIGGDSFDHLLGRPKTFYIVDGEGAAVRNAMTFVFCSPDTNNYKEFFKDDVQVRFMPVWSKDEILAARQLIYCTVSEEQALQLYSKWGGVPRAVLEKANNKVWQGTLERAFAKCPKLSDILKNLGEVDARKEVSNMILHHEVLSGYETTRMVFASQYVADRVISGAFEEAKQEVRRFLVGQAHNPQAGGMRGQVWESYAHNIMRHARKYTLRPLAADSICESCEEEWPEMEYGTFDKVAELADKPPNCYLVPLAKTNPAFDAVRTPHDALQMTVSATHPINHAGMTGLCAAMPKLKRIIFVVPASVYKEMRKQPYTTSGKNAHSMDSRNIRNEVKEVEQWVLELNVDL